jgi:CRP/FNR family transcriptional regulator, cyclic AMP receptor protein
MPLAAMPALPALPTLPPKHLSPAIATLAKAGTQRSYKKGAIILSEGDTGDTLLVLLTGSVRVYGTDGQGREVTYGTITAPDYFGEMSLDGGPRSASVEATSACTFSVLTQKRVRALLATSPELAYELICKITTRARTATHTVRSMALLDAYGRLVQVLQEIAEPSLQEGEQKGQQKIPARTTHAQLAQRIGTSREMVSKLLRDLEKGGYMRSDGRVMWLVKNLPVRW